MFDEDLAAEHDLSASELVRSGVVCRRCAAAGERQCWRERNCMDSLDIVDALSELLYSTGSPSADVADIWLSFDLAPVAKVRTLAEATYMTNDNGLEVKLDDGRVFLITIQEHDPPRPLV
jgi:hypothetical protein